MSAEEIAVRQWLAHVTPGHRFTFIVIAQTKRAIVSPGIKPGDKLTLLEKLNGTCTDFYITPEMLAMIEPASDTECEIVHEARSLDREGDKLRSASFDILTSDKVWNFFLMLNSSIKRAIDWNVEWRRRQVHAVA